MTETGSLGIAERADVIVRELRESDLPLADVILRSEGYSRPGTWLIDDWR